MAIRVSGFTLVELLVVMGIIGLLVSLLIPAANSAIVASRVGATKNIIAGLDGACQAFFNDWHCFPPSKVSGSNTQTGSAALALYLMGPAGTGWGTQVTGGSSQSPFGGSASSTYPPYYKGDARYVGGGMINDALQPPKAIFYFRSEPSTETSTTPLYNVIDNTAVVTGGTTNPLDTTSAQTSYASQAQLEYVCKRLKPGKAAGSTTATDYEWIRRDYLIISCGPDRRWGYMTTDTNGKPIPIADDRSKIADAMPLDDIGNFSTN